MQEDFRSAVIRNKMAYPIQVLVAIEKNRNRYRKIKGKTELGPLVLSLEVYQILQGNPNIVLTLI